MSKLIHYGNEKSIQKESLSICTGLMDLYDDEFARLYDNLMDKTDKVFLRVYSCKGTTKCLEEDEYNPVTGKKIASCKAQLNGLNQVYSDLLDLYKLTNKLNVYLKDQLNHIKNKKEKLKTSKVKLGK